MGRPTGRTGCRSLGDRALSRYQAPRTCWYFLGCSAAGPAGLLIFASLVTLALNVADPLMTGEYGKAAFDAVEPLLLIGWAEVGPDFLQAISEIRGAEKRS